VKVAAVIPAYNEATRLPRVLQVLTQSDSLHEIIVVNDGSLDNTAEVAQQFARVRVLNLPVNRGKGGAMFAGATATDADVILFFDADLIGLRTDHVAKLLEPVRKGEVAMAIGVFRAGGSPPI
jgi:glycosyltransferase involved in cell wall biosynthesis